jgi:hypothetical protein
MQVLDRGGKIEVLVEKTDTLRDQVCWPFHNSSFLPSSLSQALEVHLV